MSLKFPKALKELRIHFSQTGPSSQAIRGYLEKSYPELKKANPTTPILIRETLGIKPVAYARFELGKEEKVRLETKDIAGSIKALVEKGAGAV